MFFDVHESVHCDAIMKVTNKMQLDKLIYYSKSALRVLSEVFTHHREHLTVFTISGSVHPSCCRLVSHPRRQPAATWVNTTKYCNYSQVLPMMGENFARKTRRADLE
jgi:hypothetical protein